MKFLNGWLCWITCFLLLVTCSRGENPVVNTTLGPVMGMRVPVLGSSVDIFYGIPYAVPPLGIRRFQRPEGIAPWNETLNATVMPSSCYQTIDAMFDRFEGVEMWNPNTNLSEDCLYLNVFSPVGGAQNKSIIVWIFGGTFTLGSSTLKVYDGKYLAANNDVVVVTLNFRIGAFGFLFSGVDAPGNIGLLDQALALKWIKDNAQVFNADPERVTLVGESSGAVSVGLHLFSPISQDLFNNVVMQSSSPLCYWGFQTRELARKRTRKLAELLDCPTSTGKAMIQCLQNVNAAELATATWSVVDYYFDAPFTPVVDDFFLLDTPTNLLAKKEGKNASILLGVNKDEGNYFLLYGITDKFQLENPIPLNRSEYMNVVKTVVAPGNQKVQTAIASFYENEIVAAERPTYREILDDVSGDRAFKCPTIDFAREWSRMNKSVYLYSFDHRLSSNPWPEWGGVMHGYEIELIFGLPLENGSDYRDDEVEFSKEMMDYWTNFAKTDKPTPDDNDTWPAYDEHSELFARLNSSYGIKIESGLRRQQCLFWREIVPLLNVPDMAPCEMRDRTDGASIPQPGWVTVTVLVLVNLAVGLVSL